MKSLDEVKRMNAVNAMKRNTDSDKQQILETQHHKDHRQTEQLSKLSTLRQHSKEQLDRKINRRRRWRRKVD